MTPPPYDNASISMEPWDPPCAQALKDAFMAGVKASMGLSNHPTDLELGKAYRNWRNLEDPTWHGKVDTTGSVDWESVICGCKTMMAVDHFSSGLKSFRCLTCGSTALVTDGRHSVTEAT